MAADDANDDDDVKSDDDNNNNNAGGGFDRNDVLRKLKSVSEPTNWMI